MKYDEIIGQTYSRLTLIGGVYQGDKYVYYGQFKCTCGNYCVRSVYHVINSYIKSCGCLHKESTISTKIWKVNESILYRRYYSMLQRCNNPSNDGYHNYGGRGVSVCDRWNKPSPYGFNNFYSDMESEFFNGSELDRTDNNGNYSPENCRWVSRSLNNFNKRKQYNNTSGVTGVNFISKIGKWRAYITVNRKQLHLGVFLDVESAISARKTAELLYYNETKI